MDTPQNKISPLLSLSTDTLALWASHTCEKEEYTGRRRSNSILDLTPFRIGCYFLVTTGLVSLGALQAGPLYKPKDYPKITQKSETTSD